MTDLTEQLYAGTLPTGHYYFNNGVETYIVLYKNINSKHLILQEPEGLGVLCKVPSYDEWDKLNNACHELEKETACLTVDIVKLKELLKLARGLMNCTKDWACTEATENIIAKINQALGEE